MSPLFGLRLRDQCDGRLHQATPHRPLHNYRSFATKTHIHKLGQSGHIKQDIKRLVNTVILFSCSNETTQAIPV